MKTIIDPTSGKTFKFGRKAPQFHHTHPTFKEMLKAQVLPNVTVPSTTNYSAKAPTSLHNIYMNDQLGDCVIAGGFHVRGVASFNSGQGAVFTTAQVIKDYSAIGGYDPKQTAADGSNPTDNGCDENTALAYWKNTGFPDGVKLVSSIAIDATNVSEVRLALYLFENLFFGVGLPDKWVNPMPSGPNFRWDVAGDSDPNNGHCFVGVDLVPNGVKIDSWGMTGYMTHAAIAKYASSAQGGQLFSLLTPDIVSRLTQKSPLGYDINTLNTYLSQI